MTNGRESEDSKVKDQVRKTYEFAEDEAAILAKYANEPASLELHVHSNHFRFGNQEGIIPRNNPTMQLFLESVEQGVISPAAAEVFRDSGVRFYEGCVILKIMDYRNKPVSSKEFQSETSNPEMRVPEGIKPEPGSSSAGQANGVDAAAAKDDKAKDDDSDVPSYRVLLQPTGISLWHDLLYTTDTSHGRFSDQLALNMEAEILNLTVRCLDLRVPDQKLVSMATRLDAKLGRNNLKRAKHRVVHPFKVRPPHEESPHEGSSYEDFMLILDEHNAQPGTGSSVATHFTRLGCIEQLKKKRQQTLAAAAQQRPSPGAPGAAQQARGGPNSMSSRQQAMLLSRQRQLQQQKMQPPGQPGQQPQGLPGQQGQQNQQSQQALQHQLSQQQPQQNPQQRARMAMGAMGGQMGGQAAGQGMGAQMNMSIRVPNDNPAAVRNMAAANHSRQMQMMNQAQQQAQQAQAQARAHAQAHAQAQAQAQAQGQGQSQQMNMGQQMNQQMGQRPIGQMGQMPMRQGQQQQQQQQQQIPAGMGLSSQMNSPVPGFNHQLFQNMQR